MAISLDLIIRSRNITLLTNTLLLAAGVLVATLLISLPLAWITTRTTMSGKKALTLLCVMPLAIPGYVMAYALLGFTGIGGTLDQLFGIELPRISGYWGSLLAISLYTFPYLFLNMRSGLLGLDPSLEEVSRSLGYKPHQVFYRVILPQLRPALFAGALIIGLYVLGDFGAVSLMRFETFSYAIYLQYAASYDRVYAAWLALMLFGITLTVLIIEYRLLRGLFFSRTGSGNQRLARPVSLGKWKYPSFLYIGIVLMASIILPLLTIFHWIGQIQGPLFGSGLMAALGSSLSASAPAALLTTTLAVPIAYISVRCPSKVTQALERVSYLGYATPPLALALALIFFTLSASPFLYQTLVLLIIAYTLHFLAEAVGPVRSALYQASPRLEEAARSLGYNRFLAFFKSTFPLMRGGLIAAAAFVFLSAMKELPITFLLAPIGFETLAVNVWSYSAEAMFAQAAPYALTILVFSSLFVGLLFAKEWKRS
ncbi:MAG: iron ABC transporter permease [Balneolales bacterium]